MTDQPQPQAISVKEAEVLDASAIYTLALRYSGATKEWTQREVEQFIDNHRDYYVLAAKQDEEMIGYAFVRLAWGKMHLMDIVVKKEMQGQGIGRRMMKQLIDHAKAHKLSEVYLEVRTNNTLAIKMYQILSFKIRFSLPKLYNGEDGLAMYLPLSEI